MLDTVFKCVDVGLALSPLVDLKPAFLLQFKDGAVDRGLGAADVIGHANLTGVAIPIGPGVGQKLSIDNLGIGG